MSLIAWLITLGLFPGFVASKLRSRSNAGKLRDIALGTVSALAGGDFLLTIFARPPVIGLDAESLVAAAVGVSLVLWLDCTVAGGARYSASRCFLPCGERAVSHIAQSIIPAAVSFQSNFSETSMTLSSSAWAPSSNPELRTLQEQFESLRLGQDTSPGGKDTATPAALLSQLSQDVPLMMEVVMLAVRLLRRPSAQPAKGQALLQPAKTGRRRRGIVRPILAAAAVLGAAYAARRTVSRPGRSALRPSSRMATPSTSRGASRPRVRIT